jgi:hypothetical protein
VIEGLSRLLSAAVGRALLISASLPALRSVDPEQTDALASYLDRVAVD